ncbi:6375_t:CDS:2 [Funneliformis geosporum]|uniref:6375_t:CDS:1 n=1 Tax=Funneliformis geosporum TaxID=1117311 RepID=A0A9W4WS24_9GLOM|nr:6375_t:CDS:2 [Funneliformis geosporum]
MHYDGSFESPRTPKIEEALMVLDNTLTNGINSLITSLDELKEEIVTLKTNGSQEIKGDISNLFKQPKVESENLEVKDVQRISKLKTDINQILKEKDLENFVKENASPKTLDEVKDIEKYRGSRIKPPKRICHHKNIEPCTDDASYFNCSYSNKHNLDSLALTSKLYKDFTTQNQLKSVYQQVVRELNQLAKSKDNQLTKLDLSSSFNLKGLSCGDNQLTELDVSNCSNLEVLGCGINNLINLDLTNCSQLTELYCQENQLTQLTLPTKLPNLEHLICRDNLLTNLDFTALNDEKLTSLSLQTRPTSQVKSLAQTLEQNNDFILFDSVNQIYLKKQLNPKILKQIKDWSHQQLTLEQETLLANLIINKLKQLLDITQGLCSIHQANLIHKDFHSGNVLNALQNNRVFSHISDLGLSKPVNATKESGKIYGVLPYVAPEVLSGQPYSQASDIYSWGMIMYEIFSGLTPYPERDYDTSLAIQICQGLRPNLEPVIIPQLLKDLISRCWDAEPKKRLTVGELRTINSLPTKPLVNQETDKYTSKLLDFKNLPKPQNNSELNINNLIQELNIQEDPQEQSSTQAQIQIPPK